MTTTVQTTLGYHGRHGKFTFLEVTNAVIGPTETADIITAAANVSNLDSGKVIGVTGDSGLTISLPDPSAGVEFTFYVTDTITGNVVLDAQDTQIVGGALGATGSGSGVATISFVSGTSVPGDSINLKGISSTLWLATASTNASGGVLFA